MSTLESGVVSAVFKGVANNDPPACTNACNSKRELEQFPADLRNQLTVDECRRLAEFLISTGGKSDRGNT